MEVICKHHMNTSGDHALALLCMKGWDSLLIGERPTMRLEFVELGDGIVRDARQHVAEPVTATHCRGCRTTRMRSAVSARRASDRCRCQTASLRSSSGQCSRSKCCRC